MTALLYHHKTLERWITVAVQDDRRAALLVAITESGHRPASIARASRGANSGKGAGVHHEFMEIFCADLSKNLIHIH